MLDARPWAAIGSPALTEECDSAVLTRRRWILFAFVTGTFFKISCSTLGVLVTLAPLFEFCLSLESGSRRGSPRASWEV